jgi:hypothetical protein
MKYSQVQAHPKVGRGAMPTEGLMGGNRWRSARRLRKRQGAICGFASLAIFVGWAICTAQDEPKKQSIAKSAVDRVGELAVDFINSNAFRKESPGVRAMLIKFAKEEAQKRGIKLLLDDGRLDRLIDMFFALGSNWSLFWEAVGSPAVAGDPNEKQLVNRERRRLEASLRIRPFLESEVRKAEEQLNGLEERKDSLYRRQANIRLNLTENSDKLRALEREQATLDHRRLTLQTEKAAGEQSLRAEREAIRREKELLEQHPDVKAYRSMFASNTKELENFAQNPERRTIAERYLAHYRATGELLDNFPYIYHPAVWKSKVEANNKLHRTYEDLRKRLDDRLTTAQQREDTDKQRYDTASSELKRRDGEIREMRSRTSVTTPNTSGSLEMNQTRRSLAASRQHIAQFFPTDHR